MTETKPPYNLEKSPFYGLIKKHPWIIPTFGLINRWVGAYREFYEVNIKPHGQARKNK
jgi:hypothetical protein